MLDSTHERQLVQRAQSGNAEAFTEIYNAYRLPVYQFLMSKTSQRELSEDLTGDTFVKFLENVHTFKEKARLRNWLFQIAHNLAKDTGKKAEYRLVTATEFNDESAFVPVDNQQTPEAFTIANDTKAQIQAALDKLPARTAKIMTLFLVHEMPYKEIAQITGVSVARCKSLVSENRKKLRDNLQAVWNEYKDCE